MRLLLVVLAMLAGCSAADVPPVTQARDVTIALVAPTGGCSAVVLRPGLAATAAHCVDSFISTGVLAEVTAHQNGNRLGVREWTRGPGDLAFAHVPSLVCPCAVLLDSDLVPDETTLLTGFPFGLMRVTTTGGYQGMLTRNGEPHLVSTAPGAPGMSGGGLFVVRGGKARLAGVLSMVTTSGSLSFPCPRGRHESPRKAAATVA